MGDTPQAPQPGDPRVTAAANATAQGQQTLNANALETSQAASQLNQNNQYGGLTYTQTGTGPNGVPTYTANISLNPQEQALFNQFTQNRGTAGAEAGGLIGSAGNVIGGGVGQINQGNALTGEGSSIINNANYGGQNASDVIGGMTSGTTQDIMNKETSYLNPFFSTETSQLDTQLRSQGMKPGDPGYDTAMNKLNQSHGQTVTGFEAQIEPQAYAQAVSSYELPLNIGENIGGYGQSVAKGGEGQTAAGEGIGGFGTGLAGFGNAGNVNSSLVGAPQYNMPGANLIGATANDQQAQMAAYQAQLQQQSAMMSGIAGIGSTVLGAATMNPALMMGGMGGMAGYGGGGGNYSGVAGGLYGPGY
jgi:hypothetical protein